MEAIIKSALSIVVDVEESRNGMHFLDAFNNELKKIYDKLLPNDLRDSFIHFEEGVKKLKPKQESTSNETSSSTQVPLCRTRFKKAGEGAKKAFENDLSTIEEKIKASKIRIASAILEHSDNCGLATRDFMLCLKDLNSSIVAGIKAKSRNCIGTEVLDIVIDINLALANFIFKHTNKRMPILEWPQIQYDEQLIHPFYYKKIEENTTTSLPWHSTHFPKNTDLVNMIVNKEGELLIFDRNELQKLNSKTDVFETWCPFQWSDVESRQVKCMNVDENGVVYLLLGGKDKSNGDYTLLLCLEDKIVQKCSLYFREEIQFSKIFLAVAPNDNIIIATAPVKKDQSNVRMYVHNGKGNLNRSYVAKGKHKPIDDEMKYLSISSDDNIVILTYKSPKIYRIIISTMDGKFVKKRKFQPHNGKINSYNEVIYTPVTNSVTGFFFDKSKLVIETYFVKTEKFMLPIILTNIGYDSEIFDDSLRIVQYACENVALVSRKKGLVRFIKGNHRCGGVDATLKWMNMKVKTDLDSVPENLSSNANTSSTALINSGSPEDSDATGENNRHQDDTKQENTSSTSSTSATTFINSEPSEPLDCNRIDLSPDDESSDEYSSDDTYYSATSDNLHDKHSSQNFEDDLEFKDMFLDDKFNIREDVQQKLKSLRWMRGRYGAVGPNEIIPYLHIFVTVDYEKVDTKDILQNDINDKFGSDASKYFEFRQKGSEKAKLQSLSNISIRRNDQRILSRGTVTMFCCLNGKHYALTCCHLCYNEVDDGKHYKMIKLATNDPNAFKLHLKSNEYVYSIPPNTEIQLGSCRDYVLQNDVDIISIEVNESISVECRRKGVHNPSNWGDVWRELYIRVHKDSSSPVEVKKYDGTRRIGYIVDTCFSHYSPEDEVDINNAILVKCRKSFLKSGDCGVLVYFHDEAGRRIPFGYGVARFISSDTWDPGYKYYICFKLDNALRKLFGEENYKNCGCFEQCANHIKEISAIASSNASTSSTTTINTELFETSSSITSTSATTPINSEPSDQPTCDSAVAVCDRPFKPKELCRIAERICSEWEKVAILTGLFKQWDIDNIAQNTTRQSPSKKSNEMLSNYKSRNGTRIELAKAIKEAGFIDIAQKVQSGCYIDCTD
ncbi:uncharacterized protein LOC124439634 isoform X2 [Xenia sp. Carnegie-2017]|uniref:uncharacterized protein LOC124439634 isoform X2 n=1 Tax=Xenia sp. Carnegie-2017 TaxID=2897299 RepID=UPI001F04EAC3|nr:uncharacterized protein LOC124439634 isoform X2 [Xenia sp. Carnegie-2017]